MTEHTELLENVHEFNPMASPHREDPNAYYQWSRDESPISFSKTLGAYMVTRYDDLKAIADDPDTFSSLPAVPSVWNNPPEVLKGLEGCLPEAPALVNTDEPEHTLQRRAFELAFSGRRVRALGPQMEAKANALIDGLEADGKADLVTQFTDPYVRHVLSLAVGVPEEDINQVDRWCHSYMKLFSPLIPVGQKLEAVQDYRDYERYALDLIEERRNNRRDDLISDLMHGAEGIEPVSLKDALYLFRGANTAGFDTTRDTITSTMLVMMQNKNFRNNAQGDRRRIARVIEETLRKDSPHRGLMRMTTREVSIHDTTVPKGSLMLLLFGSGNRDERHFDNPDAADIDRDNIREHLAFGYGIHHCPGAPLARAEAATAIDMLWTRLPQMQPAPGYEPHYEASYFFRSLAHLDVVW